MPELPEVETTLRGIEPFLQDANVVSTTIRNGSLRWPVSPQVYQLTAQTVEGLERRGKYIICHFKDGSLIVHLGMSGSLRVVDAGTPAKKHDHVDITLSSGKIIRFNDPRRFGCILWSEEWRDHELISSMGVEPLTEDFHGDYLHKHAKGRKTPIKHFIMDGKLVVGVGNIYANEALFLSGIHPKRMAGRISKARMEVLAGNIKKVLSDAIKQGGTTLRDFVNTDGKPGYFKQSLFVYGRGGEACKLCGETLKEIRQSGRATVFCANCQK